MTHNDILLTIEQTLQGFSQEYEQIVDAFEQSVKGTESMEETKKDSVRMEALEVRCKNSQFLLERIIASFKANGNGWTQIEKYENQVSQLLSDIRDELHKNNLLEMIKRLEKIPFIMSQIDTELKTQMQKTPGISGISGTLH